MEKSKILSAELLDILFDGRNKVYGAYELRKTYRKRIVFALSGTFIVCLLFVAGAIMANAGKKTGAVDLVKDIQLENFRDPAPPPPPPPPPPVQEPQIATVKDYVPLIVPDDQVKPDDEVKPQEDIENVKIGSVNQAGINEDVIAPPVEKSTSSIEEPKVNKDIDEKFVTVQVEARFPGGLDAWKKYLESHLNSDLPNENGAPAGSYTVVVSFIVDKTGAISDVKAENDPGYGTKAEAMRVILKGPKWLPAEQNGHAVQYRHKQNITFRVNVE